MTNTPEKRQLQTAWLVLTVTLIVGGTAVATGARDARSLLLERPVEKLLLEQHNIFRQEEKAANIFRMHWNQSAEAAAGRWAAGCDFRHELAGTFGENLFYSSSPGDDEKEVLLSGLEAWHDEKRGWRYSSAACGAACHYTQMIWYSTTSLGCAYKKCPNLKVGSRHVQDALYLVCFYYPRGNWVGEYPFKTGRPCSDCGSGTCQDGLCTEMTSFTSYHGNEVRSGSTWRWSYESPDGSSKHQGFHSSFSRRQSSPNVTSFASHHSSELRHVTRGSSRHGHRSEQRDVLSHSSWHSRQHYHHRASSYRQASSFRQAHKVSELRQREVTHASGADALRELESYTSARSMVRGSPTTSSLQSPRHAQYAQTAMDRVTRRQVDITRPRERRRGPSPLDLLRADTHWCRDRLPSCRTWKHKCQKSKAVYMSCPRTCGHCGKKKPNAKPNALRDRPRPRQQHQPQQHRQRSRPQHDSGRPQQQQQQQRRQRTRQRPRPSERPRGRATAEDQRRNVQRHANGGGGGGRTTEDRRRRQRQRQRLGERGRRPQGQSKRGGGRGRRRYHPKFMTVDRRAENLAEDLRLNALNGGSCADDPKYAKSCPFWVGKGFCTGNELLSNVYCKRTCGTC